MSLNKIHLFQNREASLHPVSYTHGMDDFSIELPLRLEEDLTTGARGKRKSLQEDAESRESKCKHLQERVSLEFKNNDKKLAVDERVDRPRSKE